VSRRYIVMVESRVQSPMSDSK